MRMDLIPGLPADMALECLVRVPYQHFSSVSSVCRSWKREIELPEFWRHRKASGLTRKVIVLAQSRVDPTREQGPKKYAAAPVYCLTVCEPEMGYWAELPPMPGYSDGLPMFCQLAEVGSSLVVMGGLDPMTWEVSNCVFVYDFISAKWRRGADMPGGRRLFFACAADSDRTVFVAGGHDSEKCALKSAMAYDVARNEWAHMPDMARERDEPKGVYHRGKFLVIGGYLTSAQGRFQTDAESFDVAMWRWGPVEEDFLDVATCPRNCADGGDGKLVVPCGADMAVREGSTWRAAAEMPWEVRNTTYVAVWEGKVLVIGSHRFDGPYKTFVLDLKSCRWERVEAEDKFSGHVQSGCCLEL
ncbi:F-box/kelch-repeat protein at1g80440 [Phtheirospermum japonicum]|uniref:F-box/kelch-repeat protein at1g80440 n=1 Tax=Phtheirospermum japonicum TaxID=374723 RepID=A0A830CK63_9LAMI|nr:F-box/kelch-repeat protein at1g80440 [Phtheirospermum japonicum]